jgi:hypothetical protein
MSAGTTIKYVFPVFTAAALTMLILKLCGFAFSWWWIPFVWFFPLWLCLSIILAILGIALAVGLVALPFVCIYYFCKK